MNDVIEQPTSVKGGNGSRDKRYFPRINYRAHAHLTTSQHRFNVHILDLSFSGALAALIRKHDLQVGEEVVLTIELPPKDWKNTNNDPDAPRTIKMQGRLAHQQGHFLGIECRASGIDNQSRLRKLLEKYKESDGDIQRSLNHMMREYERNRDV